MLKKILNIVLAFLYSFVLGAVISHITGLNILVAGVNAGPVCLIAFLFAASTLVNLPRGALFVGYVMANLNRPDNNLSGIGGDKLEVITLIAKKDVLVFPARDSKGILISGNIVMKPGCYAIDVYGTQDSMKNNPKSTGGMDEAGVMQSFEFTHPGLNQEVLEFRQAFMNEPCYAINKRYISNTQYLFGEPGAPLQLTWDAQDDNAATKTKFVLVSTQKGLDMAVYQGTITYQSVLATAAADATTIDVTNGEGEYQLTNGTAAAAVITTLSNAVDGTVYTLLGSGGSHPSTISGGDFILKNGTAWTAISGSVITFKAFKTGVSTWKFIELSRS